MRSKIVFLVIFMFSFIIVHDTVFAMIDQHNKITANSSLDSQLTSEKNTQIHQIHGLFHFVALIHTEITPVHTHDKKKTISYYKIWQTLSCKETITKPPIA